MRDGAPVRSRWLRWYRATWCSSRPAPPPRVTACSSRRGTSSRTRPRSPGRPTRRRSPWGSWRPRRPSAEDQHPVPGHAHGLRVRHGPGHRDRPGHATSSSHAAPSLRLPDGSPVVPWRWTASSLARGASGRESSRSQMMTTRAPLSKNCTVARPPAASSTAVKSSSCPSFFPWAEDAAAPRAISRRGP